MGCGEKLMKIVLYMANLFFMLAGSILLAFGIAIKLKITALTEVLFDFNVSPVAPVLTMVVGSIVLLVAFFGCCGAFRESHRVLLTYATVLILLIVVKIALVTLIFVQLKSSLEEIPQLLDEFFMNNRKGFSRTIENEYQCCGPASPVVYLTQLPETCCIKPPCNIPNSYKGCNDVITELASISCKIVAGLACSVAVVELVAIVIAFLLANLIRSKDKSMRYTLYLQCDMRTIN